MCNGSVCYGQKLLNSVSLAGIIPVLLEPNTHPGEEVGKNSTESTAEWYTKSYIPVE